MLYDPKFREISLKIKHKELIFATLKKETTAPLTFFTKKLNYKDLI
jgi:hypothetical protein